MARLDYQSFKALVDPARDIAIMLPKNPNFDMVAAALGLKLSLEQISKNITVVCPDAITVEFNRLVGVDAITTNFGGKNLIITFPGQSEVVDKVSYNVDHGELQLIVTPKVGTQGIDYRKIKFVSGGAQAEVIILVGVHELAELGQIYVDSRESIENSKLIYVNAEYDPEATCHCESISYLIENLHLHLSVDAATNLFSGLEKGSDCFRSVKTNEWTFSSAANLLRRGARRDEVLHAHDFPNGSIPQVSQAPSDWSSPKIYQGNTLS